MFDTFGLIFMLALVFAGYRFVKRLAKTTNHVTEPTIERKMLDRKNIANMVIDVPNVLVIGK